MFQNDTVSVWVMKFCKTVAGEPIVIPVPLYVSSSYRHRLRNAHITTDREFHPPVYARDPLIVN